MKRETIAVDVDEVLYPFVDEFLAYHNRMHGTSVALANMQSYFLEELLDAPAHAVLERVHAYHEIDDSHVATLEGSENAIRALADRYNLVILTARHPRFAAQTTRWVSENFGNIFTDIHCIGGPLNMEKPPTKAQVCLEIGATALIDDSLGNVSECAAQGLGAVLFGDYPWTRVTELPDGVVHKKDWPSVLEYFNA